MAFQWDDAVPRVAIARRRPVPGRRGAVRRGVAQRRARRRLQAQRRPPPLPDRAARRRPEIRRQPAALRVRRRGLAGRRRPEEPRPAAAGGGLLHAGDGPRLGRLARRPARARRAAAVCGRRGKGCPEPDPARAGGDALRAEAAGGCRAAVHARARCRGARRRRCGVLPRARRDPAAAREHEIWHRLVDARKQRRRGAGRLACPAGGATIVRVALAVGDAGRGRFAWGRFVAPRVLGAGGSDPLEPVPLAAAERGEGRRACARALAGTNVLLVILDAGRAQEFGAYGYARATTPQIDRIAREGVRLRARLHAGGLHARRDVVGVDLAVPRPAPQRGLVQREAAQGPADARGAALGPGHPHGRLRRERRGRPAVRLRPRLRRVRRGVRAPGQRRRSVFGRWCRRGSRPNRDRRFFAYVHFREPHFPYDPPAPFDTRFGPDGPIPKAGAAQRLASSGT